MSRYNKKKRKRGEVELNLAAMLDMAFQLLTFFILTFKPAPAEITVEMRLPPAMPMTQVTSKGPEHKNTAAGSDELNTNPLEHLTTLHIQVLSKADGSVRQVAIGDSQMGTIAAMERKLTEILSDRASAFEQVVVDAGSNLNYESLMQVVDVCSRQKLADGKLLKNLSFAEAPE
jgi:biopolymer transport protein ExbD